MQFGATAGAVTIGGSRRRRALKPLLPHRSLDPVQSTSRAFGKHVVPHPPGAIGSIAAQEAGAHSCAKLLIATTALTARPRQPRIETAPRKHRARRAATR